MPGRTKTEIISLYEMREKIEELCWRLRVQKDPVATELALYIEPLCASLRILNEQVSTTEAANAALHHLCADYEEALRLLTVSRKTLKQERAGLKEALCTTSRN